jgi:hypothetical protein
MQYPWQGRDVQPGRGRDAEWKISLCERWFTLRRGLRRRSPRMCVSRYCEELRRRFVLGGHRNPRGILRRRWFMFASHEAALRSSLQWDGLRRWRGRWREMRE